MSNDRDPVDKLGEEFLARIRNGERVAPEDYAAAHPHLAGQILDVFPALVMLEEARPSGDATGDFAEPAATPPPERLGEYRILRQIGRGGMGVVYEAVQESLGRHVAVKVLPAPPPGQASLIDRFRREARAAARLHHTNIVPVFGVGSDAGLAFYVMQYIHGQPLDDVLAEVRRLRGGPTAKDSPATEVARHLVSDAFAAPSGAENPGEPGRVSAGSPSNQTPGADATGLANSSPLARQPESRYFRACARIARQAAEALAYAHAQGVLHRDVKPSNLLLDVHGTAWVTDFGLAKLDDDTNLTRTGDIVGTLRYMAPERFRGGGDARSDVYALGVTLYEMLTVRPAFDARDRLALIEQVTQTSPPAPRGIDRRIPRDLETIVQKAIACNPGERYADAAALADDLGRYLSDQPIRARRQGVVERTWKWAKRRPAAAGLVVVTVLAGAALIGGGLYFDAQLLGTQTQLDQKETVLKQTSIDLAAETERVAGLERTARQNLARSNLILADSNWKSGDALGTIKALADVPNDLRQWEWRYLQRRALGSYMTLWGHTKGVSGVAFSPDGTLLASGSDDRTVRLWDAKTGALVKTLAGHIGEVSSVAFSPDGALVASGSFDRTVRVWDAKTGELVHALTVPYAVWGVTFSPDGVCLASGGGPAVQIWEAKTGIPLKTITYVPGGISNVAFSPDSARLATNTGDRTLRVWDVKTGEMVQTFTAPHPVIRMAFSPDGARLASGCFDMTVQVWDVSSGRLEHTLIGHSVLTTSLAFSPDGARLASASMDKTVRLWDVRTGTPVQTFAGHVDGVRGVAFSPDGARLASASWDATVRVWDAKNGALIPTLTGHSRAVRGVTFSPDGARLASASWDATVRVWDAKNGMVLHRLTGLTGGANSVAFSPDGACLAGGSGNGAVRIWNIKTGVLIKSLAGHTARVTSIAFSPDGACLATGSFDKTVRVWDAKNWTLLQKLTGDGSAVASIAYSADGSRLVSGGGSLVRLWDAKNWMSLRTFTGHTDQVTSVALSLDGSRLACGGGDGSMRIWDTESGRSMPAPAGHATWVTSVAFSPDGARLASGSYDQTVRVWDARTGAPAQTLSGHTGAVTSVAFNRDGDRLASGGDDTTVHVWDARAAAATRVLASGVGRLACVSFSADSTRVACGGDDGTVRVWYTETGGLVQTFTSHIGVAAAVAFSLDGVRLAGKDLKGKSQVWDVATGHEILDAPEPDSLNPKDAFSNTLSRSPDGKWYACLSGGAVLLVEPLPANDTELGLRAWFAHPDPDWHWQQAQKYEKDQSWFAAVFQCEQVLKSRPDDAAAKELLAEGQVILKTQKRGKPPG